ncbi:magnesium chelatase [Chryseobacterium lactis]|uniref:Magnesium chelatase n=1 Tax=Chryseobacterium lactis TaxID=1241981 RepID=A0A3G6REP8_CHRLC|nr:sigma 54-interacting transcriptional regulator [Chryseobacterium lactis]AZA83148.1 magnesium chelatase [Chryseobacterium lactis]AZB03532.1 magnesium chelatase [Chryseobacterium lactis]PNW11962.1 magnesium chelatase [Chryseobacterium lactis]
MKNDITFKELKKSGYTDQTINEEIQANLISRIKAKEPVFEGLWGYEDTVIPQLKKAILAGHHINLLGLRGQAKTRIARSMVDLLDEYMPIVKGSEINDSPFHPISKYAKDLIAEMGDQTPISWVHRSDRFFEKLATPDVNVADLIGDIDPIKAATLKLPYSDERVLHYGMIPRANRSIFVLNELPDLQARIQVSLFNILQEGDIQIRGFQLRMPLDIQFVFTANPEDYTNRGSIVTPLKDRIGSQIFTHYPKTIALARHITEQEARISAEDQSQIQVPDLAKNLLEEVAFAARDSEYVDAKSGVSARLTISAMENLIAAAKLRLIESGTEKTTVRLLDFMSIVPSITGKIELVYEGEQEGADYVAKMLIDKAVIRQFENVFPRIPKLEKEDIKTPYTDLIRWFNKNHLQLNYNDTDEEFYAKLNKVGPLTTIIEENAADLSIEDQNFCRELVLWALTISSKIDKSENQSTFTFDSAGIGQFLRN